jgi:hypothetical protein
MPKKLAQLHKDVDAIRTRHDKQMSELSRISQELGKHIGPVAQAQKDKLEAKIKELQKTGKKIDVLGDASSDRVGELLLVSLETHKKQLQTLYGDYWRAVAELDKIDNDTGPVLKQIDAIIAEKQKQWFGSASLTAIKKVRTDLDTWRADMNQTREDLGMTQTNKGIQTLPKAGRTGGFSLSESDIRRARVENLKWRWEPSEVAGFVKYLEKHAPIEKKRAQRMRETLHDLDDLAKKNPND